MILIDGKKAAAKLRQELKEEVSELKKKYNQAPGLTVILIGDLTPSQIYVRNNVNLYRQHLILKRVHLH